MSAILEAFEGALDAQEEFAGTRYVATVGAVTNKDVIPTEIPFDSIYSSGGQSESGTVEMQMRVSDFGSPPETHDAVSVLSKSLVVLSWRENHGVYLITAGDPTTEVRN